MTTRREFLAGTVALSAGLHTSMAETKEWSLAHEAPSARLAKASPKLRVIRREETTLRLGGHGDNFHMTWDADDRQLVAICDGMGFGSPKAVYNSRLFAVTKDPQHATFHDIPGYPDLMPAFHARYYNFGTLALDGRIYQFLSALNHPFRRPDGTRWPDLRFIGAKLIYSPDNGRTWCNQDGSTPVVWESWEHRSRQNMVFFEEAQEAFSLLTILQMGRNYAANKDGYVYVYAPNGNTDGTMNELVMFRVPKAQLLERQAYEYFAGRRPDGSARWVKDIAAREVVHTFPRGWVNISLHPYAWQPSVVYNAPLDLYLMANWGTACAPDGSWFAKPSYLGFWIAPKPWGPWTQIHEEFAWMPADDPAARAYQPQIAPKWIAPDGKSFWLVWSDFQVTDETKNRQLQEQYTQVKAPTPDDYLRWAIQDHQVKPYYSFNVQRVDLTSI